MGNGINVLNLCDGISCGKVALDRAGIKVNKYFSSEIDENAIAISKKNHDGIIRLGDITKWREWDLPHIDLVLSGTPCQGFSRAGMMLNFKDERSKLFFEFVDILNDIKTKNPDVLFLFENVKMKDVWKDIITDKLGVEPIIYACQCFDAGTLTATIIGITIIKILLSGFAGILIMFIGFAIAFFISNR